MSKEKYKRDVVKAFVMRSLVSSSGQIYIDVRHNKIDGKVMAVVVVGIGDNNGLNTEAIMDVKDAREHILGVRKACQKASALMMTNEDRERIKVLQKELHRMQNHAEEDYIETTKMENRILDATNNAVQLLASSGFHKEAEELNDAVKAFF